MNNNQDELIERTQRTANTLLTVRTVMWTIAGVIVAALLVGFAITGGRGHS